MVFTFKCCIIHHDSLHKFVRQLNYIANPVVKPINFISAKGLQHQQLITFLEEIDADYKGLFCHSRGNYCVFGVNGKSDKVSDNWLYDSAFGVDFLHT